MNWNALYPQSTQPTPEQIADYIGTPLWHEFCEHMESSFRVAPLTQYSRCSQAPGWNVKYRKISRALCTLYPDEGFFTCLVSVAGSAAQAAELELSACTEQTRTIYYNVKPFNGARWLMLPVNSAAMLADAKRLVALRISVK